VIDRFGEAMAYAIWGVVAAVGDPATKCLVGLTGAIILLASGVYMPVEGWSLLDALVLSVATISTVGYGDLVPATATGRIFTIGFIFVGIGVLVVTAASIARQVIRHGHRPDDVREEHP
jgi:voltage-gated potassium channel Kch